jgi:3-hydroxyacyl-[acyl-carrier-protein] dehydratase
MADSEVCSLIPHRPPFLWVDRIVSCQPDAIETEKTVPIDLELFQGHYPGSPIMPGVILCEAIFQSGALLMAKKMREKNKIQTNKPMLTRILGARFKRPVYPGAVLQVTVKLTEELGGAAFFKGNVKVGGKLAVQVEFACSLVPLAENL